MRREATMARLWPALLLVSCACLCTTAACAATVHAGPEISGQRDSGSEETCEQGAGMAQCGATDAAAGRGAAAKGSGPLVLFVAPPERGHLNPMLALAAHMQRQLGRRVGVAVATDAAAVACAEMGVTAFHMGAAPQPAAEREARLLALTRAQSVSAVLSYIMEWEEALNKAYFPRVQGLLQREHVGVVVTDATLLSVVDAAAAVGVPAVLMCPTLTDVLGMASQSPLSLPYVLTDLPSRSPSFSQRLRTLAWRTAAAALRYGVRLPGLSAGRAKLGLPPVRTFEAFVEEHALAVVVPVLPGIDPARWWHPAVHLVGPLLPPPGAPQQASQSLAEWMEEGPFVLVSLGSLAVVDAQQLLALLHGVRTRGRRSVWARGQALFSREGITDISAVVEDMAEGTLRLEEYLPQATVLAHPHLTTFVSHAGCGSTHEALAAGVPVLAVPLFGDQPFLAARLKEAGVARVVRAPELTPGAVAQAMVELDDDPAVQAAVQRWRAIARHSGGVRRAADVVLTAEAVGAGHLQPFDHSWSWVARWSLDTGAVVAAVALMCAGACVGLGRGLRDL